MTPAKTKKTKTLIAPLDTLSPLDGRYLALVRDLRSYFSEEALFKYRVMVEVEYLLALSRHPEVGFISGIEKYALWLRSLYQRFTKANACAIAKWDSKVNHDVKAVEYWLREQLEKVGLSQYQEAIHFALTSEDVNNIAYALMMRDARELVLRPVLEELYAGLALLAHQEAATPMLGATHGQPATPTTMGKEIAVFVGRLYKAFHSLMGVKLSAKLNGATGTYAAHTAAYPAVDWVAFSTSFIQSEPIGLGVSLITTQIEPHDSLAELFDAIKRLNTILIDLSQDMWQYISDHYFGLKVDDKEVGSSTMPHKVNPIDWENGEGNLGVANALLEHFTRKLPISRRQRDLTDSTVLRNVGIAFGYSLYAYKRIMKGRSKIVANRPLMLKELLEHPEILAEAIQTVLRRVGFKEGYEALKGLTRGVDELTLDHLHAFINTLEVPPEVRDELLALRPETFLGLAEQISVSVPLTV